MATTANPTLDAIQYGNYESRNHYQHKPQNNDPMDLETIKHMKLTSEEKERLKKAGACFFCREKGHISSRCPKKNDKQLSEPIQAFENHWGQWSLREGGCNGFTRFFPNSANSPTQRWSRFGNCHFPGLTVVIIFLLSCSNLTSATVFLLSFIFLFLVILINWILH